MLLLDHINFISSYEEQCCRILRQFNAQLTQSKEKEVNFLRRLPQRLTELLQAYRLEYRTRKHLQQVSILNKRLKGD